MTAGTRLLAPGRERMSSLTRLLHWTLVRLASWYDEPKQLAAIETARDKVRVAERKQRDAVMRAEAARSQSRFMR